jgi:hypothetical protein
MMTNCISKSSNEQRQEDMTTTTTRSNGGFYAQLSLAVMTFFCVVTMR